MLQASCVAGTRNWVTRALQEVAVGLDNHLAHCTLTAARDPAGDSRTGLDEVTATIRQVIRL